MKSRRPACATLLGLAATAAHGSIARAERDVAAFEAAVVPFIEHTVSEGQTPGVQVAVVADGRLAWSRGFGLADVRKQIPVTPQTVLRAGSISKLFTATLVMHHVEADDLALDEDVNRYLPPARRIHDAQGNAVRVTIRQLLTHTSGLPQVGSGAGLFGVLADLFGFAREPTFDEYLAHGLTLRRTPGTELRYSNDAFILLGWLCGQLAATDFARHVRATLLDPLGMTASDFSPDAPRLRPHLASVYERKGDEWVPAEEYHGVWPSGSLHTTAEDLLRFARMVLAGGELEGRRYLQPDSLAEMTRLQSRPIEGADSGFGLGVRVTRYRGHPLLCHEGGNPGIAARLCLVPSEGLAVAALVNTHDESLPYRIVNRVLDQSLGGTGPFEGQTARRERSLSRFTGRYRGVDLLPDQLALVEPLIQFAIVERDGFLRIEGLLGEDHILAPTERANVFTLQAGLGAGEPVVFHSDASGTMNVYASIIHLRRVPLYADSRVLGLSACVAVLVVGFFAIRFITQRLRSQRAMTARLGEADGIRTGQDP